MAVCLPAHTITTNPDSTKTSGSQTVISTTDMWADTNFVLLLSCAGGGRFCLPSPKSCLPFWFRKIWNKSGEEGEHVGCVLQVGEEMSICARLWGGQWRDAAEKKKDAVLVLRKLNGQCEAQHPMTRRLPWQKKFRGPCPWLSLHTAINNQKLLVHTYQKDLSKSQGFAYLFPLPIFIVATVLTCCYIPFCSENVIIFSVSNCLNCQFY